MKQRPRVLIATVTAELPRFYEYYDSIDRLTMPPDTGKTSIHSSSPAKNRNIIIKNAMKHGGFTHILFTDDDHVFPCDTIPRLLSRDVDIVSGLYCMKFPPFPIIMLNNPDEKDMSAFINVQNHGPFELVEVPRVPAGCLLVKMEVFTGMADYINKQDIYGHYKDVWFTLGHIMPDEWGDDLWFCDKARAAGFKIYVDTGVRVGHITKCVLTPEWVNEQWTIVHRINSEMGVDVRPDPPPVPTPENTK